MNTSRDARFNPAPREMSEGDFIARFGGVYEHSPWIARQAYRQGLGPDQDSPEGLSATLRSVVAQADRDRLLALIHAHPDLAGRAAVRGELTAESSAEQAGAGIDQCTADEFERFQRLNAAYKSKFGFPFIMAVKGSDRHRILAAFEQRLEHEPELEFDTAVEQIHRIARFRLDAIARS
jgi:OHCU decarboxylase